MTGKSCKFVVCVKYLLREARKDEFSRKRKKEKNKEAELVAESGATGYQQSYTVTRR